jgi:hypothetical protein
MKLLALAVAGALSISAPMTNVSREQAAQFQQKLQRIVRQAESKSAEPRQTVVTEDEVNSYLKFDAGAQLPTGVTDPSIAIQSKGRLSGRAIVDLDVIRQKKSSGGWFDPVSYLTGRLPITAVGVLTTKDGTGRFELESAAVAGVPIPKTFLQEIVSYYTRTADHPAGINIDAPFELPADIERIDADSGKAVIVQ